MKTFKTALVIAAVAATWGFGASAETRIATIDIEKIVDLHPDTARNKDILRETLKDYQDEMAKLEDAVRAARKAAAASIEEARNPALGEKARKRAEEEAEKNVDIARNAEREFAEKRQDRQRDLNEQELRMLGITVRQIREQIEKYAKAKGLTAVLPSSGTRLGIAPAAFWSDDSIDITEDIMVLLGIEDKGKEDGNDKSDKNDK